MDASELQAIGLHHGSDKFTRHGFAGLYTQVLSGLRARPIKLLEIGIGGEGTETGGESLRTWYDFLPCAQIVGIDIFDKSELNNDRITTEICDQSDPIGLESLVRRHGPFDVIIDDGSHHGAHTSTAFRRLFPSLRPGGRYIIEDIQTSYWPNYGGSTLAIEAKETAVWWLKRAVDLVNKGEALSHQFHPFDLDLDVGSLYVEHNIAVLTRRERAETGESRVLTGETRRYLLQADRAANGWVAEPHHQLLSEPKRLEAWLEALGKAGVYEPPVTPQADPGDDGAGVRHGRTVRSEALAIRRAQVLAAEASADDLRKYVEVLEGHKLAYQAEIALLQKQLGAGRVTADAQHERLVTAEATLGELRTYVALLEKHKVELQAEVARLNEGLSRCAKESSAQTKDEIDHLSQDPARITRLYSDHQALKEYVEIIEQHKRERQDEIERLIETNRNLELAVMSQRKSFRELEAYKDALEQRLAQRRAHVEAT